MRRHTASFVITACLVVQGSALAANKPRYLDMTNVIPLALKEGPFAGQVKRLRNLSIQAPARGIFALCDSLFLDWSFGPKEWAEKIGLDASDIEHAVESRLRSARLFTERGTQSLNVTIHLGERVFSANVALKRSISDTGYGVSGVVTIWHTGYIGTYDSKEIILQSLTRSLDTFLTTYLRINDAACAMSPGNRPVNPSLLHWLHHNTEPINE